MSPEEPVAADAGEGAAEDDDGTGVDQTQEDDRTEHEHRHRRPWWQETALLVVVALVLAFVVKTVFVQAFYIPSESMEPGLVKNDRILVEKPSYWGGGAPQRGDVVVFADPGGWLRPDEIQTPSNPLSKALSAVGLYPSGGFLVKRVIGIPGDTIHCCDTQGRIEVNGTPLDEDSYIAPQATCNGPMPGPACDWTAGPVPAGKMFVMGDNRADSDDSSNKLCSAAETDCVDGHEYVPEDLVVGKVLALIWPLGHARLLSRPEDFDQVADPS